MRLNRKTFPRAIRAAVLAILAVNLAGCATSDPRAAYGLSWVLEQEQSRKTLQAQGFPQYNWY